MPAICDSGEKREPSCNGAPAALIVRSGEPAAVERSSAPPHAFDDTLPWPGQACSLAEAR